MAKQTRRRRSKKRRPGFLKKYKLPLTLLVGAGAVLFSLIFLARLTEKPTAPDLPPVIKPQIDYASRVNAEVEAFLSSLDANADTVQRDLNQSPAEYSVEVDPPSAEFLEAFAERVKSIHQSYSVKVTDEHSLLISRLGQAKILITFLTPAPQIPAGPLMTIIMDDLGRSTYVAETLTGMPEPVTFSVLPGEAHAARVAEIGYAAGHEVMLHVPMEPQGYPAVNPGSDALFVNYRSKEIRARFDQLLSRIPHVTGANNHMGSRFTEDSRALAPVMRSLQEKGLFFVDSRTTGHSKVTSVANQFGVPTLSRDVFLDNVADVEAIVREIRRLESRARRQGQAIGICHPYPETLEALQLELPEMRERGITVVPVSVLLQKKALAQGS